MMTYRYKRYNCLFGTIKLVIFDDTFDKEYIKW